MPRSIDSARSELLATHHTMRYVRPTETRYPPIPSVGLQCADVRPPQTVYQGSGRAYADGHMPTTRSHASVRRDTFYPFDVHTTALEDPELYAPADILRRLVRPRSVVLPGGGYRMAHAPHPVWAWLQRAWTTLTSCWILPNKREINRDGVGL